MSDASEVKQKDIHVHHQSGKAFILVELHNRIMSERDELWKRATKFVMPGERDTGESIEHYIKTLEQAVTELKAEVEVLKNHRAEYEADCKRIEYFDDLHDKAARQAKVIEKLKEKLEEIRWSWANDAGRQCDNLAFEALAAIEKEGSQDNE